MPFPILSFDKRLRITKSMKALTRVGMTRVRYRRRGLERLADKQITLSGFTDFAKAKTFAELGSFIFGE
jgi:hypothetical protein